MRTADLGHNAQAVRAVLDRAHAMDADDIHALAAAMRRQQNPTRPLADVYAGAVDAGAAAGRTSALATARDMVAAVADSPHWKAVGGDADDARHALEYAVVALTVADLLDGEQLETLLGPWKELHVGPPDARRAD